MTKTVTGSTLARAWYVMYPRDAYALGPMRYDKPVSACVVSENARIQFGDYPRQIWADGETTSTEPYQYIVSCERGEEDQ